ncbi:MAG: hypothetical protein WAX81_02370 [Candidatus Moraniibacteriota bacterium]
MKKSVITSIVLLLVILINIVPAANAGSINASSIFPTFTGPDGKEYSLTSYGLENGEDFLSVRASHFETPEEARNALLLMLREAFIKSVKELVDTSTFYAEYSETKSSGQIHLSLTKSFMRTPDGKKVPADVRLLFAIANSK